jgi:cytochrome c peroxidase
MKVIKFLLIISLVTPFVLNAQNKYVGVKMCKMCHQSEKKGNQYGVWQKSKHAEAMKTLSTDTAQAIAKAKGLTTAAAESKECLECHAITADTTLTADGVQCESCHGPGSAYKNMAIMKDKEKAIAAGLSDFKDEATIEQLCKTCHNEKSPTSKEFVLKTMWPKIKHSIPKD